MTSAYTAHEEFLGELARGSGAIIREYWDRSLSDPLAVEWKPDGSEVTAADRAAETWLRDAIAQRFPEHGILGEEFGNVRPDAEFVWVLDPIDGTKSFCARVPLFGTLIGLLHRGEAVLGCIHQPILQWLCIGGPGGTRLNGKTVRVRETSSLADAVVLTTDVNAAMSHPSASGFESIWKGARISRTWGDCHGYLLVASGFADVMMDPVMNPWDILPLIAVVWGAGGRITGWDGEKAEHASSALAACPALHQLALERLQAGTV